LAGFLLALVFALVLLYSAGLFGDEKEAPRPSEITLRDRLAAKELAVVANGLSDEWERETTLSRPFLEKLDHGDQLTEEERTRALSLLDSVIRQYESIRGDVRKLPQADDPELSEAKRLLGRLIDFQIASSKTLRATGSTDEVVKQLEGEFSDITTVGKRLSVVTVLLETRYGEIGDWSFLYYWRSATEPSNGS
jgi:hypothetical protein